MSAALVKYEAARKALAAAHRVDEVKDIRDKAAAMQLYARQAKDGELIAHATEIRKRAERRLGELMANERKAGKLATGKEGKRKALGSPKDPRDRPSLADQGVDKHLADRARKAAAMPEDKFESHVAHAVKVAVAATEDDREVIKAARAERQAEKRTRRHQRERELGAKLMAMPDKKYGVIYADPPWIFEVHSDLTGMDRAAANHYPTMDTQVLSRFEIPAADDCVLFLWATVPMLSTALTVMAAWGFEYKSHLIWKKDKEGTGYWNRNQHELLLIGVRGDVPAPAPGDQSASVIDAPVGRHSEKPAVFRKLIETMFPTLPKIELFARERADGWDVWGNEVVDTAPASTEAHKAEAPARITGNDVDTEASADARRAYYAAAEAMTVDPKKDGIPVFLQTQNTGSDGDAVS